MHPNFTHSDLSPRVSLRSPIHREPQAIARLTLLDCLPLQHQILALLCLAVLFLVSCSVGGAGPATGAPPGQCGPPLNNPSAEVTYEQTAGNGTVQVIEDTNLQDTGNSEIVNGQRYIRVNPNLLALLPPSMQMFTLGHEYGHHYRDHMHCYSPCRFEEYEADAFGARVLFETGGMSPVEEVIAYWQTSGNPGNQDHPSGIERAAFIQHVVSALQAGSNDSPTPPYPECGQQTNGWLVVYNPLPDPVLIAVNGFAAGQLAPGGTTTLALTEGSYQVVAYDPFMMAYYNFGQWYVHLGEFTTP